MASDVEQEMRRLIEESVDAHQSLVDEMHRRAAVLLLSKAVEVMLERGVNRTVLVEALDELADTVAIKTDP